MSQVQTPISFGELLDKITILEIKSERMTDQAKLKNVRYELGLLRKVWSESGATGVDDLHQGLKAINERLWVIEDDIRDEHGIPFQVFYGISVRSIPTQGVI